MALPKSLAVFSLALSVRGTSTFHIQQREWISPLPSIDASDPLEHIFDRDCMLRDSLWQKVSNATGMCGSRLPQCIWMKHFDEASDRLHARTGLRLKTGVIVLCLFLVFGIVLTEMMTEDSSVSRLDTDFLSCASARPSKEIRCPRTLSLTGTSSPSPGGSFQTKPTPICPELVSLLDCCYAVGFESIDTAAGPVQIHGRGQKLLLTAQIQNTRPGTGSVILTMGDASGPLLASISNVGGRLVIQDKHKRPYGKLTNVGHLAYSLTCGGVEAMKIRSDSRTGRVLLVNSHDGANLASAAKLQDASDLPSREEHLGISVVAGMDPILTILCIIGAMALTT